MVAQEDFTVDLNKPLVFQVGYLGDQYQEWVHQPIVSKEGPRFFGNDVLEFLTRTKWYVVPLIWLPVVFWLLTSSLRMGHSLLDVSLMAILGIFIWTLVEYILHRFLFHINTSSYWANTAHYLIHGCHHKHPMDGLRLVFPPAATAILFLELDKLICNTFNNSSCIWRWPTGIRDVRLYALLSPPWPAISRSCQKSQEIPSKPSLQNSEQGLWDHVFSLGHCFWYTAIPKVSQKSMILQFDIAFQMPMEVVEASYCPFTQYCANKETSSPSILLFCKVCKRCSVNLRSSM